MRLIFITYSFILVIVASSLSFLRVESSAIYDIMLGSYLIQVILFLVTIKNGTEGKVQYLRPFFILLLGMMIVNFQVIIDTLFSSFKTELTIWRLQSYIGKCLYLGIIAQTSLTIGYIYRNHDYCIEVETEEIQLSEFDIPKYLWGALLIFLFVVFILTIDVKAFLMGDSAVNDGSFDRKVGTLALYSELILNVFFVIIISVTARTFASEDDTSIWKYIKSFPSVFLFVFGAYLLLRLFSGDRGPVIYNLATLLFAFIYATKRTFSATSLAVILIVGALGITIIGIARKKASTLSFETRIAYAMEELKKSDAQSFIPVTQELASSVKVTAIAVRGIERKSIEQGYGRYNLMEWTNAVPFSSKLIYTLFPTLKEKSFVPTEVLTVEGNGRNYSYGLGNTAIADIYLDFGTIGIPILFFIFGMIYRNIDDVVVSKRNVSPYLLTFTLFMSSHAIYIGRSSFSFIMANACLYILIQYILSFSIRFINSK